MCQSVIKRSMHAICVSIFLSIVLFFLEDIGFITYLGLAATLCIFLFFTYCLFSSARFFYYYGLVVAFNLAVFLFKKYRDGYRISYDIVDASFALYAIIILGLLIWGAIATFRYEKNSSVNIKNDVKNLFKERKYDLERVLNYLRKYNLIGVISKWGDGKTFLFDMLAKECGSRYYVVKIGVMSITVDTVEKFVLNEINHLLELENVFSLASLKINNILASQSTLTVVNDLFFNSNSFTKQINILKKDVLKLKKKVILVFEDLDRITDDQIIYKIFSIAETLSSDHIKVVYQYNERDLLKVLGQNKLYLEKYIPHTVYLTPIKILKIIEISCKTKKYSNITKEDFDFIVLPINTPRILFARLQLKGKIEIELPPFSIRKVLVFLEDVDNALNHNRDNQLKRPIIMFYLVKHFFYGIYEKMGANENFIDAKIFEYQGEFYSFAMLLKMSIEWKDVWENENNITVIAVLILFGYNFDVIVESLNEGN